MSRGVPAGTKRPWPAIDSKPTNPGLGDRGHLRQQRIALGRRDRQRLHLAAVDQRLRRSAARERQVDLAADQVVDRRSRPLVRNVHELRSGGRVELLQRQVIRRAAARRGHVELARRRLVRRDDLGERVELRIGRRDQDQAEGRDVGDRDQVLRRVRQVADRATETSSPPTSRRAAACSRPAATSRRSRRRSCRPRRACSRRSPAASPARSIPSR